MKKLFLILVSLSLLFPVTSQTSNALSKEKIIELYEKLYLPGEIDAFPWVGDASVCDCGTLDNEIYTKATNRINFFRLVNGLSEVSMNSEFCTEAQQAALLVKANNVLTHYPDKSMKCYSEQAANGCKKSCLSFSDFQYYKSTAFITGFMWDYGESNYYVGHRKWILYTKLKEIGYGATDKSEALLTVDGVSYDQVELPEYVAYPWNGYVPVNLIFPKWSFSIPENKAVDFSNASISMTDASDSEILIEKLQEYKNYLDHTLVWNAKGLFTDDEIMYGRNSLEQNGYLNQKIKVTINNVVVDGKNTNYQYFVEPIKIDASSDQTVKPASRK